MSTQYLHDTEKVLELRNQFIEMIAHGGCPAMCKIKVWAQLKNAVIREAFKKAHLSVPEFVLEPLGKTAAGDWGSSERGSDPSGGVVVE